MRKLLPLVMAGLTVVCALAQVTTGRIEGTVNDPQGAAVPGASIKVVNKDTGLTLTAVADEKGIWVFPSMATSTYTVTVNHPGFKAVSVENVKVDAGVPSTVNVKLEVGSLAEAWWVYTTVWLAAPALLATGVHPVGAVIVGADPSALKIEDLGVTSLESIEAIVPTYVWRFRPYGQFQTRQTV